MQSRRRFPVSFPLLAAAVLILLGSLSLTGCGGTRVMTAQKTIVFEDSIFNVSEVVEVRAVREIILPDGTVFDAARMEDREIGDLFEEHDRVRVRYSVMFDERELRYASGSVDSAREIRRIGRKFDSAMSDIRRFLAHRKRTQLDLS